MKNIIAVLAASLLAIGAKAQEAKQSFTEQMYVSSICADDYPALAKAQRLEGKVICRVIFDRDGKVRFAEVLKPYNPILDKKALEIALQKSTAFSSKRASPEVILAVSFKLGH